MPKLSKAEKQISVSLMEYRRQKEGALAALRALELKTKREELVPVAEVKAKWLGVVARFKAALLAIPSTAAPDLVDVDARRAKAVLDQHVEKALRQLATDLSAKGDSDASGHS